MIICMTAPTAAAPKLLDVLRHFCHLHNCAQEKWSKKIRITVSVTLTILLFLGHAIICFHFVYF